MKFVIPFLWFVPAMFAQVQSVSADSNTADIITKVVERYGGKKLTTAKSMTIIDYNKSPWSGQGERANQPGMFRDHSELTIDFESKRKSMLSWRVSRSGKDLERFVFDGKEGRVYDVLNQKYLRDDYYSYQNIGAAVERSSDTMLARFLYQNPLSVTFNGEELYLGRFYQKLAVEMNSIKLTLFVESSTGLISKMTRKTASGVDIEYIFSNHANIDGISYARDMNLFVGDELRKVSIKRDVMLNPSIAGLFNEPSGYSAWGEEIDTSEYSVRHLADGVYQAGRRRSFPLFIDAGEFFIAAGGERELTESYEAVKKNIGADKPLKYFIVTHHHSEHLAAIENAVALGAKIVTVKENVSAINTLLKRELPLERFELVNDKTSLAKQVELFDIATAHARHYLLVYLPDSKIIFGEDHFDTNLKSSAPRVHHDMVTFNQIVESLDLDVERFISGHGPRQLTVDEMKAVTKGFKQAVCPEGYRICENG